ncbi:MAG: histidinol-phosphatase [Bacteroidales bacterium]|nr:histidinol-phosphatase [Bacteroidales bacterium]
MQILGYHNHNFFCDGKEAPEKYILEAVNQGFTHFGFSSHAPFFFDNPWSVPVEKLDEYSKTIDYLTQKYQDQLTILKSLEIDFLPNKIASFDFFREKYSLQYVIGSIHYVLHPTSKEILFIDGSADSFAKNFHRVFQADAEFVIKSYFEQTKQMILIGKPDIIGHVDKLLMNLKPFFPDNQPFPSWYIAEMEDLLKTISDSKTVLELNMRGLIKGKWHTAFIDEFFLPYCKKHRIQMVVSTDAHHPEEISKFYELGLQMLLRSNINEISKWYPHGWVSETI